MPAVATFSAITLHTPASCRIHPSRKLIVILQAFPYDMSTVKFPSVIYPLANAYDVELIDFFDGYNYRQDILELIDGQVAELVKRHEHGFRMSSVQYKLVCFVIWGQPVDAYKFFEYNYQTEWLAHR